MEEHLLELVFVGKRTSRKIHRLLTLFHPVIMRIRENMTLFLPVKCKNAKMITYNENFLRFT